MVDTLLSRPGANDGDTDKYELFLKVFSGMVLTKFEETNIMKGLHTIRTITSGKAAQFPVVGTASSAYHTPGEDIYDNSNGYLSDIRHSERLIAIDNKLLSAVMVADVDEAINHYEVRSTYAAELGRALANKFDTNLLQVVALAARVAADALFTGSPGGHVVTAAGLSTIGNFVSGIWNAAQVMDEKDVPAEDRFLVVTPSLYYGLLASGATTPATTFSFANAGALVDADRAGNANGSLASGMIRELAGFKILKSNHLPTANVSATDNRASATAGSFNDYTGDFRETIAVAFQRQAVGTVMMRDLAMESEYSVGRQGTLMVAKYLLGHGILRPECAIEFVDEDLVL